MEKHDIRTAVFLLANVKKIRYNNYKNVTKFSVGHSG